MSDHRPEHIDLCAAWALDCLDEADRAGLDQHLAAGCPQCEEAVREFSAATVLVAASAPRATANPVLRQRVLALASSAAGGDGAAAPQELDARARGASREARSGSGGRKVIDMHSASPWATWVPLAAAAVLAVTSGVLWMRTQKLESDLAAQRGQLVQLEQRANDEQKWTAVLGAPQARVSVLEPTTDGDPRLRARATYDPTSKRAVVVFENFTKPTARDYELWVIRDGAPASLGVIKSDDSGRAVLRLEDVGDSFALSAFAVSLEPEGGSPNPNAPSGPVVMLGKLSG